MIIAFRSFTGGEDGLIGILPISWGGEQIDIRWRCEIVLVALLLTALLMRNAVPVGLGHRATQAMRDHPPQPMPPASRPRRPRPVYLFVAIRAGGRRLRPQQPVHRAPEQFGFDMILLLLGGVFIGGIRTLWGRSRRLAGLRTSAWSGRSRGGTRWCWASACWPRP